MFRPCLASGISAIVNSCTNGPVQFIKKSLYGLHKNARENSIVLFDIKYSMVPLIPWSDKHSQDIS